MLRLRRTQPARDGAAAQLKESWKPPINPVSFIHYLRLGTELPENGATQNVPFSSFLF